ncbi:DUF3558 family protein [Glycomyces harbinensis]|uniref:DUF3558 domain-containing protein n=1 Tax=Glycomyces harbinensis TaxID=58114 RepID=A0A1G6ZLJ5_9ACTN|nr:DUF3558 family protein [Glycomyces harbinensis]SDE03684.1 Protein of unknown function [Glycomyces harbinensis]
MPVIRRAAAAVVLIPMLALLGCTAGSGDPEAAPESSTPSPALEDQVGALGEFAGLPCAIVYSQDDYSQFGIGSEGRTLDISERPARACYWFSIYGNQIGWIPYPTENTLDGVIEVPAAEEVEFADRPATEVASETSCHHRVEIGDDSFVTMVLREDPEGIQEVFGFTDENIAIGAEQDLCDISTDFAEMILTKIDELAQIRAERYAE